MLENNFVINHRVREVSFIIMILYCNVMSRHPWLCSKDEGMDGSVEGEEEVCVHSDDLSPSQDSALGQVLKAPGLPPSNKSRAPLQAAQIRGTKKGVNM